MRHVLHTGQTRCWDASGREIDCRGSGQDGEFRRGAPWPAQRFVVRGEVVTDGLTGLHCTWAEAFALIEGLNRERHGGRDDWRLPNRNELRSLVSYQARKPALAEGHPFVNVFLGWYWTSTTAAISPAYAWAVHLEGARMFYGRKEQEYLCWPVCGAGNGLLPRTGQRRCVDAGGVVVDCRGRGQDGELQTGAPWPEPRFTVTGEVVRDRLTGLAWARRADPGGEPVAWQEALDRVSAWNDEHGTAQLAWRLPTINELASLVDCDAHSPALPAGHPFIGLQDGYWSATTSFFECDWAWVLYLDKGACGVGHKPGRTFFVWPVGMPVSG
jgi:hypothetical protein